MSCVEHVLVGGVKVATASRAELTSIAIRACLDDRANGASRTRLMFDSNGHGISLSATNADFRRALEAADVVHADGGFVVAASKRLAGLPVKERSATTDLFHDFAAAGIRDGISHYFLGATEAVNSACARLMQELHPGVTIAGRRHGYFTNDEEDRLIGEINDAAPDMLWIGLGKPREQSFAVRNRNLLKTSWAITCGGCFNYVTGDYGRAPLWMQDAHMEWLYRAITTPSLIGRYATTSPHAIWRALTRVDRRVLRSEV